MKNWEEAALLTDVLDRHVEGLVKVTDHTLYWSLGAFLRLVISEPILASLVEEYVRSTDRGLERSAQAQSELLRAGGVLFSEHRAALMSLRETVGESKWTGRGLETLEDDLERVSEALTSGSATELVTKLLGTLGTWAGFGYDATSENWRHPSLATVSERIGRLRNASKSLDLRFERFAKTHPGGAYLRLRDALESFDYAATDDPLADKVHNQNVEKIHRRILDDETWAGLRPDRLIQPIVTALHRDLEILRVALVTSLARGRSRRATVQRFAARCETFDRERLLEQLKAKGVKPEAMLTLEFARYLFDSGFNPLVDAAACGLRPDVLDATTVPAIYVEAKQYRKVGEGIASSLRKDVAQTLNTWSRLAQRWRVPEAFLLVFRRSGRPIVLDEDEVHYLGRRLYVHCVDLGVAHESGSRAPEPVHVSLRSLMPESTPVGSRS